MPIATVPGQAGSVEAKDGAHVAGAEPCDELLEPWSGHGPARRAAKVVVDDLDITKSTASGFIDELVLAPPALDVDLHLDVGGLADVNDRLPLQERRG